LALYLLFTHHVFTKAASFVMRLWFFLGFDVYLFHQKVSTHI